MSRSPRTHTELVLYQGPAEQEKPLTLKRRVAPTGSQDHSNTKQNTSIIPDDNDPQVDHAALVTGVYVVVVQVRGHHVPTRYRRRVLLSLAAAQRIKDKSTMEGLDASIGLYKLTPVAGDAR